MSTLAKRAIETLRCRYCAQPIGVRCVRAKHMFIFHSYEARERAGGPPLLPLARTHSARLDERARLDRSADRLAQIQRKLKRALP